MVCASRLHGRQALLGGPVTQIARRALLQQTERPTRVLAQARPEQPRSLGRAGCGSRLCEGQAQNPIAEVFAGEPRKEGAEELPGRPRILQRNPNEEHDSPMDAADGAAHGAAFGPS